MARGKRLLPGWVKHTGRSWKKLKRQEARALLHALEVFNSGAAYTPVAREIDDVRRTLTRWLDELSAEKWGR